MEHPGKDSIGHFNLPNNWQKMDEQRYRFRVHQLTAGVKGLLTLYELRTALCWVYCSQELQPVLCLTRVLT